MATKQAIRAQALGALHSLLEAQKATSDKEGARHLAEALVVCLAIS